MTTTSRAVCDNRISVCLLMPEKFLRADIEKMGGIDIDDEAAMRKLAKRYHVSVTLLALRIGQLGLLKKFGGIANKP